MPDEVKLFDENMIEIGKCASIDLLYKDASGQSSSGYFSWGPQQNLDGVEAVQLNKVKTPIYPPGMEPKRQFLPLGKDSDQVQNLINLVGFLVNQLGGAVVLHAYEVAQKYNVTLQTQVDPWSLIVKAEPE